MSVWAGAQTLRSFGVLPLTTWIYRPSAASTLPICGEHRWGLPCTAYLRPELTHAILSMARRGVTPGSWFHGPPGSRPVTGASSTRIESAWRDTTARPERQIQTTSSKTDMGRVTDI